MKRIGLFVMVLSLCLLPGCDNNDDVQHVLSSDLLQQTSWTGDYIYDDVYEQFDVIFIDNSKATIQFGLDKEEHDYGRFSYTITNNKLLTISNSSMICLSGDWILDEMKDDYMRFLRDDYAHGDEVSVMELWKSR